MRDEPAWYKDAILYQIRVASFVDSDGDGVGDLRGLTERLDYLRDLGVTALWLLPFYPSPRRDDGYDIADYSAVHPEYGTLRDFRTFLREAHRRELRVVTELVLNHTSDQHPWFQRARRAPPGSRWRDFYVWSDDADRYRDARIIFKDFEPSNWTWDPVAGAYYWHRFYSHQPDLNFDNAEVRRTMLGIMDFWFRMGVDGVRLDAVPYLYEREGTDCENLPETHRFLKDLRSHVDSSFRGRMLLAEANQWPEDAVAYFGQGDECHMAFHFPLMPRLFMGMRMEDRYPILDILEQTPTIPESCQWAVFLRNHDELTLEMVTDEERDYMWRVYAQDPRARINLGIRRRLAPLLENSRRKIELMNALLFSLPGTPIIYYGDEIGMGDNYFLGDRNAVRTPMQWSPDRNAGFSRANPQRLVLPVINDPEYHYEAVNVEVQQSNPSSLLWFTKRIVALRKQFQAFGHGSLETLTPANRKVLVLLRRYGEERIVVVANLSRFAQCVDLELSEFKGLVPVELFGRVEFPPVEETPYRVTLGPHAFYWFSLEAPRAGGAAVATGEEEPAPAIELAGPARDVFRGRGLERLERLLPAYVRRQRWFRGKARPVSGTRVVDAVSLDGRGGDERLLLVEVAYRDGEAETYALPVGLGGAGEEEGPVIARVRTREGDAAAEVPLVDRAAHPSFAQALLQLVARRRRLRGQRCELAGVPARPFRRLRGREPEALPVRALGAEQTNTSWLLGERLIGKLYRRVETGPSVELEALRHLTERCGLAHVPALAGHVTLQRDGEREPCTLALLQAFVPNQGDAWRFTLDEVERFFEEVLVHGAEREELLRETPALRRLLGAPVPQGFAELAGGYVEMARLLGRRTAELHAALARAEGDPAFAPESFSPFARRSLYQSQRNLAVRSLDALRAQQALLAPEVRTLAEAVLARRAELLRRLQGFVDRAPVSARIRVHGDYHLGQLLYTGRDFVVIDFEGEPARPLGERRLKRSPLVDVAGMLRSFEYAVENVLGGHVEGQALRQEDLPRLEPWGRVWAARIQAAFLEPYLEGARAAGLVQGETEGVLDLLEVFLLEKALYEVGYELNNRPDWVSIPLRGILGLLGALPEEA